ncbi:MAG TPA: Ni/Fe hydrogenase subunit gamma [Desulfotomaculum sp.]|nr:Ni/Fe hydrogenase subunit gamma [Desulfotomaculum sp.]
MVPHRFYVQKVKRETRDTYTLELQPQNTPGELRFAPGQFNMLYVFGVGEVPISISGDPARPDLLLHTVRAVGAVTKAICRLKPGGVLGVRGPFGAHWPVEEAAGADVIIVAGGIGLAPLRPVVYHILSGRERYGRVALLYGARNPDEIMYRRELSHWTERPEIDTHITVDKAEAGWEGNVGVVTTLIPKAEFDPQATVAIVCGPEIMMRFTVIELKKRGVSEEKIYISMERNMQCGTGSCGHCQIGPYFVCKDGPVFRFDLIQPFFGKREI